MKKVLIGIVAVIVLLVSALLLFLGPIIKTAVTTVGPQLTGVPIDLEQVSVNPFSGSVRIKGLVIGNPDGFHTPSAMELGDLQLKISIPSLFSDTVVIEKILIEAPQITYEKSLRSSNLAALQENLAPAEQPAQTDAPEEPEQTKASKKVIIEEFVLENAQLHASLTALGGRKLTLSLPTIEMNDIGKSTSGTTPVEFISDLIGKIIQSAGTAIAQSGNVAGDVMQGAGDAASGAVRGATDSIKKGIGGLFGN